MSIRHDDWIAVGDAFERLALNLKLHVEEAAGETDEAMKSAVEGLGAAFEHSFDALRAATHDTAVKEDVREVASRLHDAVANTVAELRAGRQRA